MLLCHPRHINTCLEVTYCPPIKEEGKGLYWVGELGKAFFKLSGIHLQEQRMTKLNTINTTPFDQMVSLLFNSHVLT